MFEVFEVVHFVLGSVPKFCLYRNEGVFPLQIISRLINHSRFRSLLACCFVLYLPLPQQDSLEVGPGAMVVAVTVDMAVVAVTVDIAAVVTGEMCRS